MVHRGCMGLPQDLVNRIVDALHDDLPALKSVLTREERKKLRRLTQGYQDVQLRFLAYMGERGFLQHTRKIYIHSARQGDIHNTGTFTPDALRPHMHHFQSLDRVHVITIDLYDSDVWANHHKSCFAHFCPTLTSLTLRRPLGNHRHVLQFFLQFPNLENLCLEWLDGNVGRARPNLTTPAIVDQSSLPHRHFRLDHADNAVQCPMKLIYGLQHGFNLRSIELEDSFGDHDQRLLNACANTLQYLTITASSKGHELLGSLKLGEIKDLRRVTVRPVLATYHNFARSFPLIFTISSTALCELELVVGRFPPHFDGVRWDLWGGIDWFLYDRFAKHGDFKLTIKLGHCYDLGSFQRDAKEGFRWLESRGCVFTSKHIT
ncbi:hypothetical protein BJ322DRAFT_248918 [Thelephora terrestris]|uniref:Uncharacterized protein n=1 Tax=Thelephora terrestris TaxID=56493 RepID=A0A9P6HAT1_9AGAM|nr:hypothetical protein BJ322DRAFT_248918 [Thelephora terrestris]